MFWSVNGVCTISTYLLRMYESIVVSINCVSIISSQPQNSLCAHWWYHVDAGISFPSLCELIVRLVKSSGEPAFHGCNVDNRIKPNWLMGLEAPGRFAFMKEEHQKNEWHLFRWLGLDHRSRRTTAYQHARHSYGPCFA